MSTGFVLNIDEKLLKNLERADELVQDIGKHSEQTRDKFNAAFQQMATGSLNDFISKLAEAKRAISDVGSANVQFNGVVNISNQAVKASDDIVNLVSTLAKLKHIMSQMGGENFSAEGLFNMGGQTKEITKELRADLRKTQTWMTKLKEATDAYENSIGNLSANIARAKEAQHSFNEELKRASQNQAGSLINQQGQARTLNELKAYAKELQKTMANLDPKSREWDKLNKIYKQTNREIKSINNSMKDLNNTHKSLINTADQLKRAFALMFSVSAIKGYVTQIARVRGEFELQQRSLQAILQNKDEADRLWQQTIQLAVRSPFQVKELVTYTKQLAAYRVESDKLYDTTKMLADVSAGLGVDVQRLILAYGQVKAANYLRGTELRQFSEAGVNILAELAKYFTELEGRAVSVGDVFERVSKRMVTFADVEEIFKRITSEGGIFYNMQEVQAETLKGQISNLRDAIDIMLNEIGQKNEHILKSVVGVVRTVVQNWEVLVPILKAVVAGFALTRVNALLAKESIMLMAIDLGVLVNAEQKALTVTQLLNVGWKSFTKNIKNATAAVKAFVTSNPWIAALTVAIGVITKLVSVTREHNREIAAINERYDEMRKITRNISVKFTTASDKQDRDEMEKQLYRIVELANKEYNMDIKINAKNLDTKELETKFVDIRDKVFNAQAFATAFAKGMQETSKWTLQDDIFEDLTQLGDKASESFTKYRNIVEETIFLLEKRKSSLDTNEAQAYDILTNIPKDATQLEYIEKVREAYELLTQEYKNLKQEYKETGNYNLPAQMAIIADQWGINANEMLDYFDDYDKALNEAKKEFDNFVKTIKLPMMLSDEEKTIRLKTAIDKQASEKNWNDFVRQYMYRWTGQAFDVELDFTQKKEEKEPTFDNKENNEQNKLTSKRISLIKEMRREYEQLNKTFDKTASKEKVIESYTNAVNEAFKGTGIRIADIEFDSLEALATSLESLKDLAAKEGTEAKLALEKAISGIRVQIGVETKQDDDKKLKQQVDSLFAQFDLSRELEKLGLSKELMKSLFNVEYLDLASLNAKLEELKPQFKGGEMENEYEQYVERINKLSKKEQEQQAKDFVKFLTKKLDETTVLMQKSGGYLSYAQELFNEGKITAEQYSEVVNEVIRETNEGISKVNLNLFKDSDTYIKAMGSLAGYTADELKNLRESLQDIVADNSKAFSADEINAYYDAIARITEQEQKLRKPWEKTGFGEISYLNEQYKERKRLIKEESRLEQNKQTLIQQRTNLEQELADAAEAGEDTDWITEQLNSVIEGLGIVDSKIKKNAAALAMVNGNIDKISNGLGEVWDKAAIGVAQVNNIAQGIKDSFNEIKDVAASFGVDTENESWTKAGIVIESFANATENASGMLTSFVNGDIGGTLKGLVGFVGSIIKGFNQFHDAKYDAIIKTEQKNVEKLAKAYDKLEKKIKDAMDVTQLQESSNAARENLEKQIESTQKMINAEEDKKDTDEEAVEEYKTNLDELNEKLKELEAERVKTLGGFGDIDAMKSATEEFVDAWMEAYKETGDGLDALEGKFNEFLENTIKKQIVMRGANNILKGLYENYDAMFSEDSAGGAELTTEEADAIRKLWEQSKQQLNDYLLNISKSLGLGTGEADGELSGLQAGIQGITESQAEIISAYLNSLRFFVADNNSVMKQLRDYVIGTDDSVNPMLAQLRIIAQQTSAMRTLLDSVTQSGHPKGQSGIRVFID